MAKKTKMGTAVESAVGSLGDYLREQRVAAELTLRQLAEQTGVSNPYLSQIERGLRKPSADVLQQLAKALRISAEQIYVQAGILSAETTESRAVELAILGDVSLSERQKQALLDVYHAFQATNATSGDTSALELDPSVPESRNGAALRVEASQPANTKAGKSSKSEKTKTTKRSTKSSEEGSD
ncbi:MAG: helix-turn-helix transcriptional regulator [Nocardioidaceae bacterium]|jgi:transcriptional regulator with XRE-family HTH domain